MTKVTVTRNSYKGTAPKTISLINIGATTANKSKKATAKRRVQPRLKAKVARVKATKSLLPDIRKKLKEVQSLINKEAKNREKKDGDMDAVCDYITFAIRRLPNR